MAGIKVINLSETLCMYNYTTIRVEKVASPFTAQQLTIAGLTLAFSNSVKEKRSFFAHGTSTNIKNTSDCNLSPRTTCR